MFNMTTGNSYVDPNNHLQCSCFGNNDMKCTCQSGYKQTSNGACQGITIYFNYCFLFYYNLIRY